MKKIKIRLIIKLVILVPYLVLVSLGEEYFMKYFGISIPDGIRSIIIGLFLSVAVVTLFWKETSEFTLAGIKIKENQQETEEILVKYKDFKKSVKSFIVFNLAILEKDGAFDALTSSKQISEFLYAVKEMKIEMSIYDKDVEELQNVGKLKLFQSYEYELSIQYNIKNVIIMGIPQYIGGSYDPSLLQIDWQKLDESIEKVESNKKDDLQTKIRHMKKDYKNL